MIGELHTTFVFDTPQAAKVAWEKIAKRTRQLSANRWALDNADPRTARVVTILCENDLRHQFEKARALCRHGREIPTPDYVLSALRAKREEMGRRGGRRVIRAPAGLRYDRRGRPLGPPRRSQG